MKRLSRNRERFKCSSHNHCVCFSSVLLCSQSFSRLHLLLIDLTRFANETIHPLSHTHKHAAPHPSSVAPTNTTLCGGGACRRLSKKEYQTSGRWSDPQPCGSLKVLAAAGLRVMMRSGWCGPDTRTRWRSEVSRLVGRDDHVSLLLQSLCVFFCVLFFLECMHWHMLGNFYILRGGTHCAMVCFKRFNALKALHRHYAKSSDSTDRKSVV